MHHIWLVKVLVAAVCIPLAIRYSFHRYGEALRLTCVRRAALGGYLSWAEPLKGGKRKVRLRRRLAYEWLAANNGKLRIKDCNYQALTVCDDPGVTIVLNRCCSAHWAIETPSGSVFGRVGVSVSDDVHTLLERVFERERKSET